MLLLAKTRGAMCYCIWAQATNAQVLQTFPALMTRSGPLPLSWLAGRPTYSRACHRRFLTSIDVKVKVRLIILLSSLVHNAGISNVIILQLISF